MSETFQNIENGLRIEKPKIYLVWDMNKDNILKLTDNFVQVNDSYYTLKARLFSIPFVDYLGIHFSENRISKIEMFSNNINNNFNIEDTFYEHQKNLEKNIGKPMKQSIFSVFRENDKREQIYRWKFKNIELIHKLNDRFGLEERLEIVMKS